MILYHRFNHGRISCFPPIGDDMLTSIVALGWTVPKQQSKMERLIGLAGRTTSREWNHTKRCLAGVTVFFDTDLGDVRDTVGQCKNPCSCTFTHSRNSGNLSPREADTDRVNVQSSNISTTRRKRPASACLISVQWSLAEDQIWGRRRLCSI